MHETNGLNMGKMTWSSSTKKVTIHRGVTEQDLSCYTLGGGGTTITRITLSSIRSLKQWNNVAPQVEGQYDTLLKEFI